MVVLFALAFERTASAQGPGWVSDRYRAGDFPLVRAGRAADVYVPPEEFEVVRIAARDLAADVNTGRAPAGWVARAKEKWVALSRAGGALSEDRLEVLVDWSRAPKGENISGTIEIEGAGSKRIVGVPVFNPPTPRPESLKGFVESGGVVSIEAEHFTSKADRAGAAWQVIPGLGRTGDSVAVARPRRRSCRSNIQCRTRDDE